MHCAFFLSVDKPMRIFQTSSLSANNMMTLRSSMQVQKIQSPFSLSIVEDFRQ